MASPYFSILQHLSPAILFHMVHLLEAPLQVNDVDIITFDWEARNDTINTSCRLRVDGKCFSTKWKVCLGGLPTKPSLLLLLCRVTGLAVEQQVPRSSTRHLYHWLRNTDQILLRSSHRQWLLLHIIWLIPASDSLLSLVSTCPLVQSNLYQILFYDPLWECWKEG